MTTTLCSGQQQSFRPFGLSAAQRSYMPDSLRELDSQRRNNKSETFVTLHPSLSLTTSPSNHLGMFYHCGFTLGLHLPGILFFFLIVAFVNFDSFQPRYTCEFLNYRLSFNCSYLIYFPFLY